MRKREREREEITFVAWAFQLFSKNENWKKSEENTLQFCCVLQNVFPSNKWSITLKASSSFFL